LGMASPFLRKGPDLAFERPGVARLLINLPVGLGDRFRPHQPARIEVGKGRLALPLLDPLAHPRGIDPGVNDQMGDVDILWTEFARRTLRHRAQAEFGAGKGSIADTAAHPGGGASEENVAPTARQHQARRLATGQKARVTGHLPDLAKHPLGGLDQWEIDIGPHVEDADLERCSRIGVLEERGDLFLLARIERPAGDSPARRFDLGDQRRQLITVPSTGENCEAFGREFLGDRAADKIPGADHRRGRVPVFQWSLL
jgi:hypothetical protein